MRIISDSGLPFIWSEGLRASGRIAVETDVLILMTLKIPRAIRRKAVSQNVILRDVFILVVLLFVLV